MSLRRFIPYIILALLPCILLYPVLEGRVLLPAQLLRDVFPWRGPDPKTLVPWNVLQFDGIAQFYPWRLLAASTWRQGYVPLWNPYEFCGTPFLANSQSAVLYPPNALFAIIPVAYAFGISALLHLFLAGAFLYAFLRRACELSRSAALLGAAIWQLSTWQISWLALPTFLDTSCWIPLALLCADRLARGPSFARAAALGLVLGIMLLAGHLQIAFYGLLFTLAYALFCVKRLRTKPSATILYAAVAAGVMVMVAAPQLLPALELSRMSHRAGSGPTAAGYAGYVGLALPIRHLVTLFIPGFFGHPQDGTYWDDPRMNFAEVACYVGVPAFILACLGILAFWRVSGQARFFAVSAIVVLLLALGTPLDALLYFGIPGFGQTGSPARILVLWALSLATLSAFGVQALFRREAADKPRILAAFAITLALLFATLGYTFVWLRQTAPDALANVAALGQDMRLFAGLVLALAAIAALYWRGTASRRTAAALIIFLAVADLLFVNGGYNPTAAPSDIYPATPLTTWLTDHEGLGRIMPINREWSLNRPPTAILPPNAATAYGLFETQGYDSLQTGQYVAFAWALDGDQSPSPLENGNMVFTYGAGSQQAREAGARYLISLSALAGFGNPVFTDGQAVVYRDDRALPRARMVGGAPAQVEDIAGTREIVHYKGQGDLVLADQWYPGWKAIANGVPIDVTKGPDVFRTVTGLKEPSGVVEFRYEPTAFRLGLYLACMACMIFAATIALTAANAVSRTTWGRLGRPQSLP